MKLGLQFERVTDLNVECNIRSCRSFDKGTIENRPVIWIASCYISTVDVGCYSNLPNSDLNKVRSGVSSFIKEYVAYC